MGMESGTVVRASTFCFVFVSSRHDSFTRSHNMNTVKNECNIFSVNVKTFREKMQPDVGMAKDGRDASCGSQRA